MKHIADYIVKKLNDVNPMSLEESETCKFGIYHNLYMILNILTSLIVGLLMHMLADTIILNIAYIAIRIQAGGHHASNPLKCFINSTLILIIDLLFIKYISFHVLVIIGLFILACSFIWHIAPVETRNHLLDAEEIEVYRKRSRIVLIAESIAFFVMVLIGKQVVAFTIAVAVITEVFMLLTGIVSMKMSTSKKH